MSEKKSCPHVDACPMYELFRHAGTLAVWQINYCAGEYTRCERYKLNCQNVPVPKDLLPNGARLALRR